MFPRRFAEPVSILCETPDYLICSISTQFSMYTLFTYIFYFAGLYGNFRYPFFTAYRVIWTFSVIIVAVIFCLCTKENEIIILWLVTYLWKLSSPQCPDFNTSHVLSGFLIMSHVVSVFCALTFDIAPAPPPLLLPHCRNHPAKQTVMHISNFQYLFSRVFLVQQFGFEYNMCQWSGSPN